MGSFKDNKGRTWNVDLDAQALERIKDAVNVDLPVLTRKRKIERLADLMASPRRMVEMLWAVCFVQAGESNITPEDFGGALARPDVAVPAFKAFWLAVTELVPDARLRGKLRSIVSTWTVERLTSGKG
jgi:hypothetical protein